LITPDQCDAYKLWTRDAALHDARRRKTRTVTVRPGS
jgi:hypothetical protein